MSDGLSCSSAELLPCNLRVVEICPSECKFAKRLAQLLPMEILFLGAVWRQNLDIHEY
jgi:hypothetical protein